MLKIQWSLRLFSWCLKAAESIGETNLQRGQETLLQPLGQRLRHGFVLNVDSTRARQYSLVKLAMSSAGSMYPDVLCVAKGPLNNNVSARPQGKRHNNVD